MQTQVNKKSFTEIVHSADLVLVDFFTEWCGPCKMMKPVLEEVKTAVGDKVKIIKIDAEKNIRASTEYQITGVPTLILFKNGTQVWRQSGVVTTQSLKQILERYR